MITDVPRFAGRPERPRRLHRPELERLHCVNLGQPSRRKHLPMTAKGTMERGRWAGGSPRIASGRLSPEEAVTRGDPHPRGSFRDLRHIRAAGRRVSFLVTDRRKRRTRAAHDAHVRTNGRVVDFPAVIGLPDVRNRSAMWIPRLYTRASNSIC